MKKDIGLCLGCMSPKNYSGVCRSCGYSETEPHLPSYLEPGTELAARYVVGKLLSYNGEGAAYLAYDTLTNSRVSIREYMPDSLCRRTKGEEAITVNNEKIVLYKTYLSEFLELHKTLKRFQTEQITAVDSVFEGNNTAYAVFRVRNGVSFKSFLSTAGGILPWAQVRDMFFPLLQTLSKLHEAGVIHRAISPATLFVTAEPDTKLILSCFSITAARTYGTPIDPEVFAGYAAPELYSDVARHGAYTDIYGAAAVMYKALTGENPPDTRMPFLSAEGVRESPSIINRSVPASVAAVIMKAMSEDAANRMNSSAEFLDRLSEADRQTADNGSDLIIKRPRAALSESGDDRKPSQRVLLQQQQKKRKNMIMTITICVVLGLALGGFLFAIIYPATHPELYVIDDNSDAGAESDGTAITDIASGFDPGAAQVTALTENTAAPAVEPPPAQSQSTQTTIYEIPDFIGYNFDVVQNSPLFRALKITAEYEYSNDVSEGEIFKQSIDAGVEAAENTELILFVSNGPETVLLPDYYDLSIEMYRELLGKMKIRYEVFSETSESVPAGFIIRCSKNPGDTVSIANSETIQVYYSSGLPAGYVPPQDNGGPEPEQEPESEAEADSE